jgi:hypothetical protein
LAGAGPEFYQPMLKNLTLILGAAALLTWLAGAPRKMQHTNTKFHFPNSCSVASRYISKDCLFFKESDISKLEFTNDEFAFNILVVIVTLLLRYFEVKKT